MALPAQLSAALAVTSDDPSALNTATFDNVTVNRNVLANPGFEWSTTLAPGWVSDTFRQTPAQSETTMPHSGTRNGACRKTAAVDCGLHQEVTAPATGNYMFRFFVHADQPGALVGVNINGSSAGFAKVDEHVAGYYQDGVGVLAKAGDTIRVWMYSPATPGSVLIDDASLVIDTGPR